MHAENRNDDLQRNAAGKNDETQGRNKMKRTALALLSAAILAAVAAPAAAQNFPTKPINLIVPWPAGGSTDIAMRAIAERRLEAPRPADHRRQQAPAAAARWAGDRWRRLPSRMATPSRRFRSRLPSAADAEDDMGRGRRTSPTSSHLTGYTFGVTDRADSQFKTWKLTWSNTPRPIPAR
jgi:hypothetical protein